MSNRIQETQARLLANKLPLAEQVSVSADTAKFRVDPTPVQNPPFIGALIAQVDDTLEDCLLSNNGLLERDREARVLQRASSRYANDPQPIEMDHTSVAVSLRRKTHETATAPRSRPARSSRGRRDRHSGQSPGCGGQPAIIGATQAADGLRRGQGPAGGGPAASGRGQRRRHGRRFRR